MCELCVQREWYEKDRDEARANNRTLLEDSNLSSNGKEEGSCSSYKELEGSNFLIDSELNDVSIPEQSAVDPAEAPRTAITTREASAVEPTNAVIATLKARGELDEASRGMVLLPRGRRNENVQQTNIDGGKHPASIQVSPMESQELDSACEV